MKKMTAFLLMLVMLFSVLLVSVNAETTVSGYAGNTDCTCGGTYGEWIFPTGAECVGSRYYRECDSCDETQTAKDITPETISYTLPAIGANEGDIIMLSLYDVYFTSSNVVSADQITWSSEDIEIVDNQIYTTVAGTYKLTATSGSSTKTIYLIVKKSTDTEYVLFYDDFSRDASLEDENGQIAVPSKGNAGADDYEIINQPSGTKAYFEGGYLVLDSTGNTNNQMRVILPKWIGDFGDYKIDTTFTILSTMSNNNSYWFATMARVKNDSDYYPIWQAAVRQGAKDYTNNKGVKTGVEISYRDSASAAWAVPCQSAYTENINPKDYYTQTFEMIDTVAYHSINGTAIQNTIGKSKQPTEGIGLVGFHLRASVASVDSIKITVPIDDSIHEFGDWETITPDTCTTDGLERRACSICQTVEERTVKGGHKITSYALKAPTCTESGYRAYEECGRCDYTTFSGEVGPLGHYFDREIKCIAHRGYSTTAPENTLAAYRLAKEKGFSYAECDVSFTKDNVAVLLHDTTIDRTSNGSGNIADLNYEELLQYDFGSWKSSAYAGEKIPTFEEFIALCKKIGLHPYIEIKNDGETYTQEQVQALVAIVEKYDMQDNCTWISFSLDYLAYVKNVDSTARLGYVSSKTIDQSMINSVLALKTDTNEVFLDISYNMLNENNVMLAALNGLAVETWTVDNTNEIKNRPKYVSGYSSNKLVATDTLLKTAVTAPTCDAQGYTTYTCMCGESVVRDYTPAHDEEIVSIAYPNGFDKVGIKIVRCLDCDAGESELEAVAIFTCLGYSVPENGRGGVAVGFAVDHTALKEYQDVTGKTLSYGAFAVSEGKIEGNKIFDENGNAFKGALLADVTEYGFSVFHIEIAGFADAQKDLSFAMGAYIAETDGETTEYSYVQRENPSEGAIYHFVSYNYVVNFGKDEE